MIGTAASPTAAPSTGTTGTDTVPDGTAQDVLAWVGDDPARAQAAYDAELQRATPRTTLLAALESKGAQG